MGNTLTGQIVAETYEALLKVTDNGIITGTKKRITDGFGNDTPLLLSSTDVQIDGNFLLPGTTLQYVRGDGSLATFPTIISTLTTTGSSGASTLIGSTLNIPNYTLTGLGGVPTSRTLTINGTTFDLSANRSWTITDTGLTSVGISMPSAFTVSNSPLTANGTIAITGAGLASQYIRGDGTLANFPTTGGGGSSVSYYLNGSVNQGTILGNVYRELNKTPIIGAGTDFTINSNGYIAQFITDANDPSLLEIPAGNWNFEMFFSASSGGGSPSFYVELYKYDGTAFTLIATDSATPEGITNGTAIDLYTTALAVPQTTLTITDRLAIRVYVTHSGRTITLHTENSHLCQVITTFSTGINALNSLTKQVQYFAVGTSGTDFAISSDTDTHTFNLPTASGTNRGALSSADWTTFNSKVPSTRTLTINGTSYDLSADRSWTIAAGLSGSGTTNYVAKFTGTSSIGNSVIFDNGTNLGIGTSSPIDKLTVSGRINVLGTNQNSVWFNQNAGGTSTGFLVGRSFGSADTQDFFIYDVSAGSARMFINSSGSVGIGTTTPASRLSVWEGEITISNLSSGFTAPMGSLAAYNVNANTGGLIFKTSNSGTNAEKMRITYDGNLGIGITNPSQKLEVYNNINAGGGFKITNINGGGSTGAATYYHNGNVTHEVGVLGTGYTTYGALSANEFYAYAGNANMSFGADGVSSSIKFGTGSGVPERMRITSSGNVLIGTTSDNSSGAKLQVSGSITYQNTFNRRTASYTLALTDQNDIVEMNVASANNLTIPLNSSVAFPIGTEIQVLQYGAGQTTIVATGGVTTRSKSGQLKIANQYTGVTLVKVGTDEWYVIGNLTA
jgi:hypothetical protein